MGFHVMRVSFLIPLALLVATAFAGGKYDDLSFDDWRRRQTNYFGGAARPRDIVIWETYQFKALSEHLEKKYGWAYRDTLKLDDRNDIPAKLVNHYRGSFLKNKKGELDYYFKNDEVWLYYYPRVFSGVLLVFRDDGTDGLIVKGDDKDGRLDGIGYIDAAGNFREIEADYFPETKNYEFTLPDGRLGKANVNWYRKALEETVRANISGWSRWFDFNEALPGGRERGWAQEVGINPRTGMDERSLRLDVGK